MDADARIAPIKTRHEREACHCGLVDGELPEWEYRCNHCQVGWLLARLDAQTQAAQKLIEWCRANDFQNNICDDACAELENTLRAAASGPWSDPK